MSEKQEKKKEKKEPNIYWIDGIPCLELPKGSVIFKRKIKQQNPYNHPYTFGWLQEEKKRKFMPDILDELKHLFNVPFFPANWRIYEFTKEGEIKPLDEEEENDNGK